VPHFTVRLFAEVCVSFERVRDTSAAQAARRTIDLDGSDAALRGLLDGPGHHYTERTGDVLVDAASGPTDPNGNRQSWLFTEGPDGTLVQKRGGPYPDWEGACRAAHALLAELSVSGWLDRAAADLHPDFINQACDRVAAACREG
jgi:hypothetical protein